CSMYSRCLGRIAATFAWSSAYSTTLTIFISFPFPTCSFKTVRLVRSRGSRPSGCATRVSLHALRYLTVRLRQRDWVSGQEPDVSRERSEPAVHCPVAQDGRDGPRAKPDVLVCHPTVLVEVEHVDPVLCVAVDDAAPVLDPATV